MCSSFIWRNNVSISLFQSFPNLLSQKGLHTKCQSLKDREKGRKRSSTETKKQQTKRAKVVRDVPEMTIETRSHHSDRLKQNKLMTVKLFNDKLCYTVMIPKKFTFFATDFENVQKSLEKFSLVSFLFFKL